MWLICIFFKRYFYKKHQQYLPYLQWYPAIRYTSFALQAHSVPLLSGLGSAAVLFSSFIYYIDRQKYTAIMIFTKYCVVGKIKKVDSFFKNFKVVCKPYSLLPKTIKLIPSTILPLRYDKPPTIS